MLVRPDFHRILAQDPHHSVMKHFYRAVHIRQKFSGLPRPGSDQLLLPNCHEVARGYARAFETDFEDGFVAYVSSTGVTGNQEYFLNSLQVHSWNVIRVTDEARIILDIFPDVGLSMMPVIHPYPHPAYVVPQDGWLKERIKEVAYDPMIDVAAELLADEFRRLENIK